MSRRAVSRPKAPPPDTASATPAGSGGEGGVEPGLRELRSSVANLRAAADALALAAVPRPASSARASRPAALLQAVIEEAERASRAVDRLAALLAGPEGVSRRETTVAVADLVSGVVRRAAAEFDLAVHPVGEIDPLLAIADLFAPPLLGALGLLRRDYGVTEVELSARRHADLLALEVAFSAREPESSRLRDEHHRVLAGGAHGEPPLGEAARAAGGEAWLAIRRGEARFSLRLLLPISEVSEVAASRGRPGRRNPARKAP